eukprot:360151-Chlamydomonas_euryale.AAC.2
MVVANRCDQASDTGLSVCAARAPIWCPEVYLDATFFVGARETAVGQLHHAVHRCSGNPMCIPCFLTKALLMKEWLACVSVVAIVAVPMIVHRSRNIMPQASASVACCGTVDVCAPFRVARRYGGSKYSAMRCPAGQWLPSELKNKGS